MEWLVTSLILCIFFMQSINQLSKSQYIVIVTVSRHSKLFSSLVDLLYQTFLWNYLNPILYCQATVCIDVFIDGTITVTCLFTSILFDTLTMHQMVYQVPGAEPMYGCANQ